MKNKQIKINKIQKRDFRFEVANLITEARYHYELTQAQLAKKVGTQQPSIARIESGSTLPSLSFLERLADSIGTYLIAPKFGFMKQDSIFTEEISEPKFNTGSGIVSPFPYDFSTSSSLLTN
ncbi:helix-turn-helix transcriptional regulator [Candidatus Nomurabacteria bacterium]|nr:helix-turn-helix transcriptional regulator [Candidatus Nomurabacteria bacterium]